MRKATWAIGGLALGTLLILAGETYEPAPSAQIVAGSGGAARAATGERPEFGIYEIEDGEARLKYRFSTGE
jgi:hypothetical protein